jgi:hypothetical protein
MLVLESNFVPCVRRGAFDTMQRSQPLGLCMKSTLPQAKNPLILRYHRLMDAFAKSDDERDFYLDKVEGFLVYVDLDKSIEEIEALEKEITENKGRFGLLPKMTFYEIKKFMEGFIHEKVYDIDTKEKLIDMISQKEARENFLEFIYDHLAELEKWQLYYQERSRIRIIEWLRTQQIEGPFHNHWFVFEEDLDVNKSVIEKIKRHLFDAKVTKDLQAVREILIAKARTYYHHEATHPKAKRGRPPKQVVKVEMEPQVSIDIYTQVPNSCRPFLYIPDITSAASVTFSSKFESEEHLLSTLRGTPNLAGNEKLEALAAKLYSLKNLSTGMTTIDKTFGLESMHKAFAPFAKAPKFKDSTSIEVMAEEKSSKMDSAIGSILPKKRGRPRKDDAPASPEEFTSQRRPRFGIKKVTQISKPKKEK